MTIRRALVVAPVSLWVLVACGHGPGAESEAARPAPLVEAVAARFGSLPFEETVPAVVRASNQVVIRPEIAGRVVEVLARSGDTVASGQPLVRLEPAEMRERLRQADADVRLEEAAAVAAGARVAELESRAARMRALAAEELVSAQELETLEAQLAAMRASADEAQARVEQVRAAADEMRSALAKTVVRAPVAGSVGARQVEIGMRVDPSTPLFVVGNLDEVTVEVTLTEAVLARVAVGQPVLVETRSADEPPLRAVLSRISPFLAADSFTTQGEIDVDNREGRLRPGMFVTARILVGESREATLVPVSAVREDPVTGERGVFAVDEAAGLREPAAGVGESAEEPRAVSFRPVTVLAEGGGRAGVEGIDEGTWVVTVGQQLLAGATAGAETAAAGRAPQEAVAARVRPVSWARVLGLQDLQDEDLLEGFLDKQQKLAAALGAEIPESESVVDQVLEDLVLEDRGLEDRGLEERTAAPPSERDRPRAR